MKPPIAAVVLTLAAPAFSTSTAAVRLTPIPDSFSGSACRIQLDKAGKILVGGSDNYNDRGWWRLGISGREYRLKEHNNGSVIAFGSRSPAIAVRLQKHRKVWESPDASYPAQEFAVSVDITANGARASLPAFLMCGDG